MVASVRTLMVAVALALVASVGAGTSESASASKASGSCPVTLPNQAVPPGAGFTAAGFNYGHARLRVHLNWPDGTLTAGNLPGGGVVATVRANGSIRAKLGWWRGVPGKLVIGGRRLDSPAPPLRASVPNGYGSRGFQPTGLIFANVGCWKVIGRVGLTRLTFVVRVTKVKKRAR